MKMTHKSIIRYSAICLAFISFNATATLIGDRTTFESSLGSVVTDDYQNAGYVFVQSDAAMSSVLGETQYTSTGFANNNIVFESGGNKYYCAGCNGSFLLDFANTSVSGANGVFGVGFDYFNADSPLYNAFITYGDGSTDNVALDLFLFPNSQFFGVTSPLLISTIHFGLANGGTTQAGSFVIDDLTIGNSVGVPEPSLIALLSIGLLGIGIARRKKA